MFRYGLFVYLPSALSRLTIQIFYFGYFTGSFIAGRGLQYFHAGKFMGIALFIWGGTLLACIGANGFATLMVLRFLLG